jgi:nucleotide-binding universal stress UspA family protein
MRPKIVIAYDGTSAAGDGLALGALLADLRDADLLLARVLPHEESSEATERAVQHWFNAALLETREAAAEQLGGRPFELWPLFGVAVAQGITTLAAAQGAELIVFGSPHHGPVGRVLLGNAATAAGAGAPCAIAVAPRGFRARAALEPPTIGVAFDGSAEAAAALYTGLMLARSARASLRALTVEPTGWSRPLRHHGPVAAATELLAAAVEDGVDVETRTLRGHPVHALAAETQGLGLLVCGSHARGPLSRVVLGSVSSALLHRSACPVVVVPRRVTDPVAAAPRAALTHH